MDFHFHLFKVMNGSLFFLNVPHPAVIKDNSKILLTKMGEWSGLLSRLNSN